MEKPWLNEQGHSFDSSLSLSKPEQTITAGYQIPLEDVLHDYYRVQYAMKMSTAAIPKFGVQPRG